jgi:hypothetical protein
MMHGQTQIKYSLLFLAFGPWRYVCYILVNLFHCSFGLSYEEKSVVFISNIRENGKIFVRVGDISQKNLSFT